MYKQMKIDSYKVDHQHNSLQDILTSKLYVNNLLYWRIVLFVVYFLSVFWTFKLLFSNRCTQPFLSIKCRTNYRQSACPLIDKLKHPSLSPDSESAPHCKTTASGWYTSMTFWILRYYCTGLRIIIFFLLWLADCLWDVHVVKGNYLL